MVDPARGPRNLRTNAQVVARAHAGEFGPYKETILTTPVCGIAPGHVGDLPLAERIDEHRLFLNMRPDPTFWRPDDMDRMLDELAAHATVGLESDPMYFATLALRREPRSGRSMSKGSPSSPTPSPRAGTCAGSGRRTRGPSFSSMGRVK